jgi:hypothetical protein
MMMWSSRTSNRPHKAALVVVVMDAAAEVLDGYDEVETSFITSIFFFLIFCCYYFQYQQTIFRSCEIKYFVLFPPVSQ